MSLNLPAYNRKNVPAPSFLAIGEYDVSLYQSRHKQSRGGNDMMLTQFIVDNGPSQGGKVNGSFFFGHDTQFGEKMLNDFANNARKMDGSLDPAYDPATGHLLLVDAQGQPTLDAAVAVKDSEGDPIPLNAGGFAYSNEFGTVAEFCRQFEQSPALRVHVRVYHEYDIQLPDGTWESRVSKEKHDAHVAAGGRGGIKAQYRIMGPPKAPATLTVIPKVDPPASAQGDGQAAYPQQAAPAVAPSGTSFPFGG